VETVINNPTDFRVLRFETDRRGRRRGRWMRMNKGITNLWRYVQIGEATNRRYLDALAQVTPSGPAIAQLDSLCRPRLHQGHRYARFNPISRPDAELFHALIAGSDLINGLSNRDLQQRLWPTPPRTHTAGGSPALPTRLPSHPKAPRTLHPGQDTRTTSLSSHPQRTKTPGGRDTLPHLRVSTGPRRLNHSRVRGHSGDCNDYAQCSADDRRWRQEAS
jgi:hypothetical protein